MTLNLERIYSREAYLTAIGTAAVTSPKDLPVGFFDGMCGSAAEAQAMAFRVNMKRREARNNARARRGLAGVLGR